MKLKVGARRVEDAAVDAQEAEMLSLDPALSLRPETAFFILLKAREFDAKVENVDPDEGSNPSDDRQVDVLEFQPGDAAEEELSGAIGGLNEDERLDLIALAWIGRGDFTFDEWAEARRSARVVHGAARYLKGMPSLGDYLEEALAQLGLSVEDYLDGGGASAAAETGAVEAAARLRGRMARRRGAAGQGGHDQDQGAAGPGAGYLPFHQLRGKPNGGWRD